MEKWQVQRLKDKYGFELVQTHISWVLLGESVVYKIKKPVDFGFLDYTTLEKRKFYCEKEVELNSRLSKEIYLGVSSVVEKNGELFIDEDGDIVDYAVKMKRMPQDRMMNVLIEEGKIKQSYIVSLAKKIADFHLHAETNEYISSFGSVETNKFNTDENFEQTKDAVGEFITAYQYNSIKDYTDRFYEEKRFLFEKRVRDKRIRDCHGDLYSRNICIIDENTIYVYDCIEFNERFRYSDVASDVAFLLMDLENYERYDLSELFLDRYVCFSEDSGITEIVDFYKIYRAYVRGKIAYFQSQKKQANLYFDLSFGYLPDKYKPKVIVICGLTGSGKSTVASFISKKTGFEVLSSDVVRKELAGMDIYDRDLSEYKGGIYVDEMTERVYKELCNRAYNLARNGKSVVLDATFIKERYRKMVVDRFRRLGIKPFFAFLEVDEKTALEHFKKREMESSVSDGRYEIFLRQKEELEKPEYAFFVDGSKSALEIADKILERVGVKA